ncbi:MAG TPA: hypothetical protein VMX54_01845 [Vicinamibacteria bacterium]|nr:hypothetical protein [Vicinamibacteria bacterium]
MRTARVVACSSALAVLLASAVLAQAQPAKPQTASQFYLAYRAAFDKATKIEDLYPFLAAKNLKQAQDTPKADRDKMFQVMKLMGSLSGVKVTKEEHTADGGAILTAEGLGTDLADETKKVKQAGKITVIKEGGAWKVGEESWK